jgi:hypothetical protein
MNRFPQDGDQPFCNEPPPIRGEPVSSAGRWVWRVHLKETNADAIKQEVEASEIERQAGMGG